MYQKPLRFVLTLLLVTGAVYLIHKYISNQFFSLEDHEFFLFCYFFNVGFTFLFTTPILLFAKSIKDQVGFAFLAQGMLKIGLFFWLIKSEGFDIGKNNFLIFFIPYLVCLGVELFFVVHILKDENNE